MQIQPITITSDARAKLERFKQDRVWFQEHQRQLLAQYPEQWVAIYNQRVVGTDPDYARRLGRRLGIDPLQLPHGVPSTGVGGRTDTRIIQTHLSLDTFSTPLTLNILDPTSALPIPSLLGRDMLSRFALSMEARPNSLVLLDPDEADAVGRHLR